MSIREKIEADQLLILSVAKTLPEWFSPKGLIQLEKDLDSQPGYVATDKGKIIGFLTFFVNQGEGIISWMGIATAHHRKGIGTKLLNELKTELKRINISSIIVSTLGDGVDYEPYSRTRQFYRKNGFLNFKKISHPDNLECEEELLLRLEI